MQVTIEPRLPAYCSEGLWVLKKAALCRCFATVLSTFFFFKFLLDC